MLRFKCILYFLQELVNSVDKDGNGKLDFLEFLEIMVKENSSDRHVKEEMLALFRSMDERGVGYITPDELRYILRHLGERVDEEEIEGIISEVDSDGNGRIDFDEFFQIMVPSK